eukprot:4889162-Pleurochrysis_carterae.AAC.1
MDLVVKSTLNFNALAAPRPRLILSTAFQVATWIALSSITVSNNYYLYMPYAASILASSTCLIRLEISTSNTFEEGRYGANYSPLTTALCVVPKSISAQY